MYKKNKEIKESNVNPKAYIYLVNLNPYSKIYVEFINPLNKEKEYYVKFNLTKVFPLIYKKKTFF